MAPQRSTLYSTPEVFNPIARLVGRDSGGPVMLLGIGGRGKRFLTYLSNALEHCEVPHVAYLLQQDGREEDDGFKRGYRKIVDAKPFYTASTSRGSATPGTAVIVDDMIDTFAQGAGANFFALEHRKDLGYSKDLLTVVHYDLMGIAHFSLDLNDRNRVVVGDRDKLVARLREIGPQKFGDLEQSGALRYIGRVDRLMDMPDAETPESYATGRVKRIREALREKLGLKGLRTSGKPIKAGIRRPVTTSEEFLDEIASGE